MRPWWGIYRILRTFQGNNGLRSLCNLTERIDRLTKEKSFQNIVAFNSIVMTEQYAEKLAKEVKDIPFKTLEIESIGLSVKNFDDISKLVYVDVVEWFETSEHQVRKVV